MANEEQQQYEERKERTAALTELTLQSTDGRDLPPTPTQEENDLLALGLMHPDDKEQPPQDKAMPSVAAQQAYLATGEALPSAPSTSPQPTSTTTTSAPRTTGATGASGATTGASGASGATGASGASGATGA